MRMIRCMCSVTRLDKIINDYIKESLGITKVARKIRENRLGWFGLLRVDDNNEIVNKISETRVERNRKKDRPKYEKDDGYQGR